MSISSFSGFSRSIVFKVLLVLIFSMTLVVTGSILIFNSKQTDLMLDWSFNNNGSAKDWPCLPRLPKSRAWTQ